MKQSKLNIRLTKIIDNTFWLYKYKEIYVGEEHIQDLFFFFSLNTEGNGDGLNLVSE